MNKLIEKKSTEIILPRNSWWQIHQSELQVVEDSKYISQTIFLCFLCSFTLSQVSGFGTVENGMQVMLTTGWKQYDIS